MKAISIKTFGILAAAACAACVCSCTALDELPDNRTEIESPQKVSSLLTSAYPSESPALICELASDNILDNNVVVPTTRFDPYFRFHNEAYQWSKINDYAIDTPDTPYQIWEQYYAAISVCNHAIDAMLAQSDDPAHNSELAHSWGEAHVLRAYLHFVLVNLFAETYKDAARSSQDRGIPYVTRTESKVQVDYDTSLFLHSVKVTYDLIEKDLLEGIDLIDDSHYQVPAYHFNSNAALAFAARFYLFKRDYDNCLKYANKVLGSTPVLRDWKGINKNTPATMVNGYNSETAPWNYMIQATSSLQWRTLFENSRYSVNEGIDFRKDGKTWHIPSSQMVTLWGSGPNWSGNLPAYSGMVYVNSAGQQYGAWLFRLYEYFEYTDKIAGIGHVHMIYQPFSADETLLCRAEAKLYTGDQAGAIQDLNLWTTSHLATRELTLPLIRSRYSRTVRNNDYVSELHPAEMGFEKVLTGDDLSVLDCILHFRRVETIHEGLRWFDIKRYGITVRHFSRAPYEDEVFIDSLTYDDPRRVFELPNNVIESGYTANRTTGNAGGARGGGYATLSPNTRPTVRFQDK